MEWKFSFIVHHFDGSWRGKREIYSALKKAELIKELKSRIAMDFNVPLKSVKIIDLRHP